MNEDMRVTHMDEACQMHKEITQCSKTLGVYHMNEQCIQVNTSHVMETCYTYGRVTHTNRDCTYKSCHAYKLPYTCDW